MNTNVGTAFTNPNIISNCTGLVCGIESGIERVIGPLNVLTYVEIEAFAVANLVAQMESNILAPRPIWTNLKTFPAAQFYGKVHGITGGYPCQPFSCAGQRQGAEDPRHLWPFIEYQMSAIRPVWGFFENVGDHLSLGFDTVYKSLRRMGYRVEAGIYTAEEAGAPHERERLFIFAIMDDPEIHSFWFNFDNQRTTYRNEYQPWNTGSELANPHLNGHGASSRGTGHTGGQNERTTQGENGQWLWPISVDCRSDVAHSKSVGQREPTDEANPQSAKGRTRYEPSHSSEQSLPLASARDWKSGESNQHGKNSRPLNEVVTLVSQQAQDISSTPGKRRELLNPAWVAQLMGTTLEKIFSAGWATEWWNKPLK